MVDPDPSEEVEDPRKSKRVVSQMAKVFRSASTDRGLREGKNDESNTGDELSVGIQYVKALGADDGQIPGASTRSCYPCVSADFGLGTYS